LISGSDLKSDEEFVEKDGTSEKKCEEGGQPKG
jgi:hypothetical protein